MGVSCIFYSVCLPTILLSFYRFRTDFALRWVLPSRSYFTLFCNSKRNFCDVRRRFYFLFSRLSLCVDGIYYCIHIPGTICSVDPGEREKTKQNATRLTCSRAREGRGYTNTKRKTRNDEVILSIGTEIPTLRFVFLILTLLRVHACLVIHSSANQMQTKLK